MARALGKFWGAGRRITPHHKRAAAAPAAPRSVRLQEGVARFLAAFMAQKTSGDPYTTCWRVGTGHVVQYTWVACYCDQLRCCCTTLGASPAALWRRGLLNPWPGCCVSGREGGENAGGRLRAGFTTTTTPNCRSLMMTIVPAAEVGDPRPVPVALVPPGSHLDPTWVPPGSNLGPTWVPPGSHLGPTWVPPRAPAAPAPTLRGPGRHLDEQRGGSVPPAGCVDRQAHGEARRACMRVQRRHRVRGAPQPLAG
jgi:hypothetical protein